MNLIWQIPSEWTLLISWSQTKQNKTKKITFCWPAKTTSSAPCKSHMTKSHDEHAHNWLKGKCRRRMGRGEAGGTWETHKTFLKWWKHVNRKNKQMNKNGKDKMTQKEHKQPREVHKQINKIFLNTYKKNMLLNIWSSCGLLVLVFANMQNQLVNKETCKLMLVWRYGFKIQPKLYTQNCLMHPDNLQLFLWRIYFVIFYIHILTLKSDLNLNHGQL